MSKNFNGTKNFQKKQPRQPQNKKPSNHFKFKLVLPVDTPDSVYNEILDVLTSTMFGKISFPVSTYRYYLDESVGADDARVITTGYVKDFNPDTNEFSIVVFPNNRETIAAFKEPGIEVVFTTYPDENSLGTITKFNIVDLADDEEESSTTEEPATTTEE